MLPKKSYIFHRFLGASAQPLSDETSEIRFDVGNVRKKKWRYEESVERVQTVERKRNQNRLQRSGRERPIHIGRKIDFSNTKFHSCTSEEWISAFYRGTQSIVGLSERFSESVRGE